MPTSAVAVVVLVQPFQSPSSCEHVFLQNSLSEDDTDAPAELFVGGDAGQQ